MLGWQPATTVISVATIIIIVINILFIYPRHTTSSDKIDANLGILSTDPFIQSTSIYLVYAVVPGIK